MSSTPSSPSDVAGVAPAVSTVVDFRSDTVTKPTAAMRAAMAAAEVGDDVFGDDPTVIELQRQCAALLGKEAGLFVPSGTMGNLLSVLVHVDARGGEMILGNECHIHSSEQGNSAQFGGVHSRTVPTQPDGTLLLSDVEAAIRHSGLSDDHSPLTQLICIENTHNRMGGRALPVSYMDALGKLAKSYGLKLHVDGARLLNAAVALGVEPRELVAQADSVSLCLSKGLGAPVGSVIVGTVDFIRRAKRLRKALGGGMRQAGILAAAGLLAINEMSKGLAEDHRHTRELARVLRAIPGVTVPAEEDLHSNILYTGLAPELCTPAELCAALKVRGVLLVTHDRTRVRFVLHHQVDDASLARATEAIKAVLEGFQKK